MDKSKDAYGRMIWNSFNNFRSFLVVERDDGYINVDESAKSYFKDFRNWENDERESIGYARGRVLDIGCGAGRIMLYLQKNGYNVTGIDTSPLAIKVCRLRGCKDVRLMSINDIWKFKSKSFDSILMFGYNFGLFGNRRNTIRLLKYISEITVDSGVIIAQSRDPYVTDNPIHFKYHNLNLKKGRLPGQLRLRARFMQYATDWHDYLYVSEKEMRELLLDSDWHVEKIIKNDDFDKNGLYTAIISKIKIENMQNKSST